MKYEENKTIIHPGCYEWRILKLKSTPRQSKAVQQGNSCVLKFRVNFISL